MSDEPACTERRDAIMTLVLGELNAMGERDLNEHLEVCPACRNVRDLLAAEERDIRLTFDGIAMRVTSTQPLSVGSLKGRDGSSRSGATGKDLRQSQSRAPRHTLKWLSVAAAIAIAAAMAWSLLVATRSTIAYADVVKQLQRVDVVSFEVVIPHYSGPAARPRPAVKRLWVNGARSRCEDLNESGRIECVFVKENRDVSFAFNPSTRKYVQRDIRSGPVISPTYYSDKFAALVRATPERDLGQRTIDGRLTRGFQVRLPDDRGTTKVWADAVTGRVLRTETHEKIQIPRVIKNQSGEFHDTITRWRDETLQNIRWDEPMPDDLFKVPQGYREYAAPSPPPDGARLAICRLAGSVKLTLTFQDETITQDDVSWVALHRAGETTDLLIRLSDAAWEQISRSAPWNINLDERLYSTSIVDHVKLDRAHKLVMFDVTPLAPARETWLTPPHGEVVVGEDE